jgi:CheY-like chemotaxis protein
MSRGARSATVGGIGKVTALAISHDERRRVLVVDDEPDVCAFIGDALDGAGMIAVCVQSDAAAYKALGEAPFAALVVDVNLGMGTTGFDVARFARRVNPSINVIYVTGSTRRTSFLAFGVPGSDFLEKPFRAPELVRILRNAAKLGGRS